MISLYSANAGSNWTNSQHLVVAQTAKLGKDLAKA